MQYAKINYYTHVRCSYFFQKLEIWSFVRELGVPYTFIHVGWWMQLVFTHPANSPTDTWVAKMSRERHGDGNVKTAVTSFDDIGHFVSRIIADPRTINQYVFCWSEEVSLNEVYPVFERLSGQKLRDLIVPVRIPLFFFCLSRLVYKF